MIKRDEKDNITQTSLSDEVDRLLAQREDFTLEAEAILATTSPSDDDSEVNALETSACNKQDEAVTLIYDAPNVDQPSLVSKKKKGGLKARVTIGAAIGLTYLAVALLTILLGGYVRIIFDVFVIGVSIVAAFEMSGAVGKKYPKPMRVFIIVGIVLGFTAFYLVHFLFSTVFGGQRPFSGGITAFFFTLALVFLVCILYNIFSKKSNKNNVLATMLVLLYPVTLSIYMLSIRYLMPEASSNLTSDYGFSNVGILLMFLIPAFSDTTAFFVGSLIKGKKLAPRISPKKTISGAVGGVFGGMAAGGLVLLFSQLEILNIGRLAYSNGLNIAHFLIIGAVGAVFVIIGDLIASYIKRQCDIKDFSNLLPGHGGILDRIDSMLLSSVFIYVYMFILTFI